ncbi:hypothetical protein GCM10023115_07140 [Pontixanthobacter gangjinensis]|uniref:Tetracyclin repressor-like C-terminal domain-containing protein n=1 Tax=Pontixanthobacter gangjinensis TaxID=1028742 RepID=A0A6I4SJC4_9SPHN|nr:hypothetical protein [Pontixanthobacter gangjinensis]MXO55961.1 hypothetical protein [Pontixanthobacter gangjinensis]
MTQDDMEAERGRFVALAMDAIKRRGEEVNRAILARETRTPRAKIDALFPEETDLFDAIVAEWFAPLIAIIEEVIPADLPPNRKFYEFYARRFLHMRQRYLADPAVFELYCELGKDHFERVESYIDLADHYLSELIAQAQADGFLPGLKIDQALSLINQMMHCYTQPDVLIYLGDRLTLDKLARIIDTLFAGLSAKDGGASGVAGLRTA